MPDAVKTFIRRQLAFEKIEKAFADLRKPVDEYQQDCRKYDLQKIQLEREKKKVPPPPAGPNFEKLGQGERNVDRPDQVASGVGDAEYGGRGIVDRRKRPTTRVGLYLSGAQVPLRVVDRRPRRLSLLEERRGQGVCSKV